MNPERQKKIDNIHQISGWIIKGIFLVGLIALFFKPGNWFWWVAGIPLGLAVLVNIISDFWATDEEKEERKEEIKEAVREVVAENEQVAPKIISEQVIYDPFVDSVTEEQKKAIMELLHDLPSHKEKKGEINMSVVARYLTALVELEFISKSKSADVNELRKWVETTTGKHTPEQFRFNDAFPSTYRPGINKAKDKINQILKI